MTNRRVVEDKTTSTVESLLASTDVEDIRRGLKLAEKEFDQEGGSSVRRLVDLISTLFYVDPL